MYNYVEWVGERRGDLRSDLGGVTDPRRAEDWFVIPRIGDFHLLDFG